MPGRTSARGKMAGGGPAGTIALRRTPASLARVAVAGEAAVGVAAATSSEPIRRASSVELKPEAAPRTKLEGRGRPPGCQRKGAKKRSDREKNRVGAVVLDTLRGAHDHRGSCQRAVEDGRSSRDRRRRSREDPRNEVRREVPCNLLRPRRGAGGGAGRRVRAQAEVLSGKD